MSKANNPSLSHAVLTGDLVASTQVLPAVTDAAMDSLNASIKEISGWRDNLITGFARRGGDGWQVAIADAALSFRATLFLLACLRRDLPEIETRIAVAEAQDPLTPDNARDLNTAHGSAFTASGRLLEAMPRDQRLAHATGGAQAACFRLADHIARGWTQAQARALAEALPTDAGPRAEAAARLGISREAVNQALWAAGFPALDDALDALEGAR